MLQVLRAKGKTHKNVWKTANLHLLSRIQTLAGKVSCFLKMLKLQREKSKQSYPAGSRASFQKGSMGSWKSRAETVRMKGGMCLHVRVAPCVSEAEHVWMCLCVEWQGFGKQPVGRALGSPSRQTQQLGCCTELDEWQWGVRRKACCLLLENRVAQPDSAFLGESKAPAPFAPYPWNPESDPCFLLPS